MSDIQTYFSDISCLGKIRLSGVGSPEFIRVMTTVELERIEGLGQAAPALILNAEGEILDLVMIGRTGDQEFLVITNPETVGELVEWLQAHAELADAEGVAIFEGLAVEDSTEQIASFALYGPDACMILNELSKTDVKAELGNSSLTIITIGQLEVMLFGWPFLCAQDQEKSLAAEGEVYEVYFPAKAAEDFEQILLGFIEIDPESYEDYKERRRAAHTWFDEAEQAAYIKPESAALKALLRSSRDFVGAKALGAREE